MYLELYAVELRLPSYMGRRSEIQTSAQRREIL